MEESLGANELSDEEWLESLWKKLSTLVLTKEFFQKK